VLQKGTHCDMPTLFERLRGKGDRTVAFPIHEPWLDVGRPADCSRPSGNSGRKRRKERIIAPDNLPYQVRAGDDKLRVSG